MNSSARHMLNLYQISHYIELHAISISVSSMIHDVPMHAYLCITARARLVFPDARPLILDVYSQNPFSQQGDRTSIRCLASGNPTPEVTWLLDDQPLRERSHISVGSFIGKTGDVISYVNISKVTLLEGGDYTCVATNRLGRAENVSRLNVYGKEKNNDYM